MRMWRNWQTRKIQVLMVARLCRFKSCHPHQAQKAQYVVYFFKIIAQYVVFFSV